jgi:hypothetical protein
MSTHLKHAMSQSIGDRAYKAGREFGQTHKAKDVTKVQMALEMRTFGLWGDMFQYGALDYWRADGQLK